MILYSCDLCKFTKEDAKVMCTFNVLPSPINACTDCRDTIRNIIGAELMKYLDKSFTVAVTSPGPKPARNLRHEEFLRERAQLKAKHPHSYVNAGSMCLICGLDRLATIHQEAR